MKYLTAIALSITLVFSACAEKTVSQPAANPKPISSVELEAALSAPNSRVLLVDVRTAQEYAIGRIPGALLFPFDRIEAAQNEFATLAEGKDRPIVVYCQSGRRSGIAAKSLVKLGYSNVADLGAISNWTGPLEQ